MKKTENLIKEVGAKWLVRIPENGEVDIKVKKGGSVDQGEVIVEIREHDYYRVDVSEILKTWKEVQIEAWKKHVKGRSYKKGEELIAGSGWGAKKISVPVDGVVEQVDEFGQVYISMGKSTERLVKSPVAAKISKIEKDKIVLSFDAWEIGGKETGKGKIWAELKPKRIKEITLLKSDSIGKVVILEKVDQLWLNKAEAMGVAGIIMADEDKGVDWEDLSFDLPVIVIGKEKYEALLEKLGDTKGVRVMINSNSGRLLVVVQ